MGYNQYLDPARMTDAMNAEEDRLLEINRHRARFALMVAQVWAEAQRMQDDLSETVFEHAEALAIEAGVIDPPGRLPDLLRLHDETMKMLKGDG